MDDVLDVAGAMQLLRVGRNTVYELVARNEIPHRRLGKQIRFSRVAIMRWFASWSSQGAKEGH
jgi:excisionase family DNA binding protein